MRRIWLVTTDHLEEELWFRDVESFVRQFKHRYSIYYNGRWGIKKFLRLTGVDIREIPYEDEAPERAVAYVQMTCVAANICSHPSQYPYGTGDVFFSQKKVTGPRLGDLSARARARLLHTYEALPLKWHLGPEGFIPPYEYVDVGAVETLFRKPTRMNYFLTSSSKARKRLESEEQTEFMRQIRFRFSADVNQIARVCGLSYAEAARMIDGI